jgi:hypothetical protein
MVVDGVTEFVGSDGRRALSAIGTAARATKVHVRIAKVSGSAVRVEVDAMNGHSSGVYLAVVEREGNSQVLRGENRGRSLHHVAIVRRIEALGKCDGRKPFATEVRVAEAEKTAFGLVAFVQDSDNGPVRGAAALGR